MSGPTVHVSFADNRITVTADGDLPADELYAIEADFMEALAPGLKALGLRTEGDMNLVRDHEGVEA